MAYRGPKLPKKTGKYYQIRQKYDQFISLIIKTESNIKIYTLYFNVKSFGKTETVFY